MSRNLNMAAKYSSSDSSDFQPSVRDKLQVQPAPSTQIGRTENPEVTGAGNSKRKLNRSWDNATYSPLKYPRHAVRENEFQRAPRSEIGSRYLLNSTPLDSPDRRKNFKSPDGKETLEVGSEADFSSSEPDSDNSSHNSASETDYDSENDDTSTSMASSKSKEVIYFLTDSANVQELLQNDYPGSIVIVDTNLKVNKASFDSRKGLKKLMKLIVQKRVGRVLIAQASHICKTQEAFHLFEWTCRQFDVDVFISSGVGRSGRL